MPQPRSRNTPASETAVASLVTHCIYEIATGVWPSGQQLPSIRQAEQEWGVDRRVVMRAYHRLSEIGLVDAKGRSGFFVCEGAELGRLARHRYETENLYARVAGMIREDTDLSVLGVFRYFAQYAEQQAKASPEVAFVECSDAQADGHAREVSSRLGIPCQPLTTSVIGGKRSRVPAHVRTLLVTGFHYGEINALADANLRVVSVPIGVSRDALAMLPARPSELLILEYDETEGESIQRDIRQLDGQLRTRVLVVSDVNASLAELCVAGAMREGVMPALSPRVWRDAEECWRQDARVVLIEFLIRSDAWPRLADAIGLPLGDVKP